MRINHKSERGGPLLEVLMFFALLAMVMPFVIGKVNNHTSEVQDVATAAQMRTMREAVDVYLLSKRGKEVTGSGKLFLDVNGKDSPSIREGARIPDTELESFLPEGLRAADFNVYIKAKRKDGKAQAYTALIRGPELNAKRGARVAAMIGSDGGYVEAAEGKAFGALGLWELDSSDMGGSDPDLDGRVVAKVNHLLETPVEVAGAMSRFEVPGFPDANRMKTDLDMNRQQLRNVSGMTFLNDAGTATTMRIDPVTGLLTTYNDGVKSVIIDAPASALRGLEKLTLRDSQGRKRIEVDAENRTLNMYAAETGAHTVQIDGLNNILRIRDQYGKGGIDIWGDISKNAMGETGATYNDISIRGGAMLFRNAAGEVQAALLSHAEGLGSKLLLSDNVMALKSGDEGQLLMNSPKKFHTVGNLVNNHSGSTVALGADRRLCGLTNWSQGSYHQFKEGKGQYTHKHLAVGGECEPGIDQLVEKPTWYPDWVGDDEGTTDLPSGKAR